MNTAIPNPTEEIFKEIQQTPVEYLPRLLCIVKSDREAVTLNTASDSFQQGWKETLSGDTHPISNLWDKIDAL